MMSDVWDLLQQYGHAAAMRNPEKASVLQVTIDAAFQEMQAENAALREYARDRIDFVLFHFLRGPDVKVEAAVKELEQLFEALKPPTP